MHTESYHLPFPVRRCSIAYSRIEYAFESPVALHLQHWPMWYSFSFISIVLLHSIEQDQTMTHNTAVRSQYFDVEPERKNESVVEFDLILPFYCVKGTEIHTVAIETHMTMPRFVFLSDLTESSCSSFTAVLLLDSEHLVYFCPLFSFGNFLHLVFHFYNFLLSSIYAISLSLSLFNFRV